MLGHSWWQICVEGLGVVVGIRGNELDDCFETWVSLYWGMC